MKQTTSSVNHPAWDSALGLDALTLLSCQELAIRNIVREATGREPTAWAPIDPGWGMSNEVIVVTTPEGRLVVRLNKPGHLPRFEKEAWCLEQAHAAGVLVPRVLAYGAASGHSYSIASYIEGSSRIDQHCEILRVWEVIGAQAAKLNRIHVSGYGTEMLAPGCFQATWPHMLSGQLTTAFRDSVLEEYGMLSARQVAALQAELEKSAEIKAPAGICVWDIGPDNARIRGNDYREIYLLDFEFALAAPVPHYQLACVAKPRGLFSEEMAAFTLGYGISSEHLEELLPDLKRLVVLGHLGSVRWAQDRRPECLAGNLKAAAEAIFSLLGERFGY